jgi:dephospho-CoA kinase
VTAPFRIGLTGGIASGKSTVALLFAELGVPVIDTDQLARDVVAPGTPVLTQVIEKFGISVLLADGSLNRTELRRRVFQDPEQRLLLEQLLHPAIRLAVEAAVAASTAPYVLIAIPLLAETGGSAQCDRVLVVDCPPEVQLQRLLTRDSETKAQAERMIAAQASRSSRLAIADDVLQNTGSTRELETAVLGLHARYLALAARHQVAATTAATR